MARLTLKSQGELASFLSAGKAYIRSLKVHFTPKQAGSGDPSPENVRPITGWTGVSVTGCGKNLCPAATGADIAEWPVLSNPNRVYKITGLPPNEPFTLSATITETTSNATTKRLYLTGGTSTFISTAAAGRHSITVNSKSDGTLTITHNKNGLELVAEYITDVQLELGSTATAYEPYTGTTYTLDWTSDLGTIYGGYVDLISGEVVEEWDIIASYNGESLASEWLSDRDVYASGTTPTTGAQVAYELATPTTHQLTPQSIQTLTGQNTFWSSADSIEVEYDLIETRDTWMHRRHMFALSSPHIESLTGTTLQFETDMTSKLKECKVYFSPVQEGTGDPSPDNVRPIHGWDGVTVNVTNEYIKPKSWEQGAINGAANTVNVGRTYTWLKTNSNTRIRLVDLITLNETHQYKVTWNTAEYELCAQPYDSDGLSVLATSPFNIWQTDYFVFSTPNVAIALRRKDGAGITPSEMETANVEITEATVTQITIPFPQTIYGGYVDLVKGEVVETHTSPTSWTATKGGAVNQYGFITYKADQSYVRSTSPSYQKCNTISKFGSISISTVAQRQCEIVSGSVYVALPEGENVNDIQVVYRVATPLIHTIDPVTIRTLRGMNNIFSDANGNIEIKYWTH